MNKEELIKGLSLHRDTYTNDFGFGSGARAALKLAIIKIGKLDELDELEKVVVPKFVADVFDYNKNAYWEVDEAKDVSHILKCAFGDEGRPSEFLDWVSQNPEDYVMAVRNGCEVEKEQLYYVLNNHGETLLVFISGTVRLSCGYALRDGNKDKYQLTEKQIKDYDERYLPFMVPINEVVE